MTRQKDGEMKGGMNTEARGRSVAWRTRRGDWGSGGDDGGGGGGGYWPANVSSVWITSLSFRQVWQTAERVSSWPSIDPCSCKQGDAGVEEGWPLTLTSACGVCVKGTSLPPPSFSLWDLYFVFFISCSPCLALMFKAHQKTATLCFESLWPSHKSAKIPFLPFSSSLFYMQLLTSRSSCQTLHVSHSWVCAASVCTNMFVILIACAILCRWLSCSHYGYHSWNRTEAGLMQAICMCDTTQNNKHTVGGFFVFHKSFVVLSYHVTLKVPINNYCIKEFYDVPRM